MAEPGVQPKQFNSITFSLDQYSTLMDGVTYLLGESVKNAFGYKELKSNIE